MSTVPAKRQIVLGPELDGTRMTPEEFDAVEEYDDNYYYELVHGVLVVNPIPLESEVGPNEMLGHWLLSYRESHPQGTTLDATLPERYIRTLESRRRPDRLIWAGLGRIPNWRNDLPTIAVEFVSADRRDRQRDYVDKRREYMAVGIREYWIIDRFRRILAVVRNQPGEPQEIQVAENQTYSTPLLPGFELPLGRLLALADAMDQPE